MFHRRTGRRPVRPLTTRTLRSETYAADTARTLSSQRRIRGTRSFLGIQTGRGNKTSHVPRTLTTESWEILFPC